MKTKRPLLLLLLIGGAIGCGDDMPAAPSGGNPTPLPAVIAEFQDPSSTFRTPDIRDVQEQIVRFDTANNALIWVATNQSFPGYPVSGLFLGADRAFQVRFGTVDGQRRAYFTETGRATICDINVVNGMLSILPTDVTVPGGG